MKLDEPLTEEQIKRQGGLPSMEQMRGQASTFADVSHYEKLLAADEEAMRANVRGPAGAPTLLTRNSTTPLQGTLPDFRKFEAAANRAALKEEKAAARQAAKSAVTSAAKEGAEDMASKPNLLKTATSMVMKALSFAK